MGLGYVDALAEAGADVAVFDLVEQTEELVAVRAKHSVKIEHYMCVLLALLRLFLLFHARTRPLGFTSPHPDLLLRGGHGERILTDFPKTNSVDVSSASSLEAGFSGVEKDFGGKLDICVANAGINKVMDFLDMTWEAHRRLVDVNVLGVYHTVQLAARLMIKSGTSCGSVIVIGSIAGKNSVKLGIHSAYSGTKGAVLGLLPAIAKELGQHVKLKTPGPRLIRPCLPTCLRSFLRKGADGEGGRVSFLCYASANALICG